MWVKFFKHSWLCWLGFAFDYYHASEGLCHVVKLLLTKQIRDYRNCNEDNGDGAVVLYFVHCVYIAGDSINFTCADF